ncbi:MAG: BamA/TamA family outer membrane protein [Bacteroidota bacterium]
MSCVLFSQPDSIFITKIIIKGNSVTNNSIILRELTIKDGEFTEKNNLEYHLKKSRENLLNLSLFNFVDISLNYLDPKSIEIDIYVEERWYIWLYPILEHADRNFNNYLKDEDWDRINYGAYLEVDNFRGRNENLKIKVRLGFKEQYSIGYKIPYFDKKKQHGLDFSISFFRQKVVAINTVENKLVYFSSENNYLKKYASFNGIYCYRPFLKSYHYINLTYYNSKVSDLIIQENPYYYGCDGTKNQNLTLGYQFIYDNCDIKYYPTKGLYFEAGFFNTSLINDVTSNFQRLKGNLNKYFKLSSFICYSFKIKVSKTIGENPAYVTTNALGYDEYLRGYEYYVIDGSDYYIFNNSFRFKILPEKIKTIDFISFEKFKKIHYSVYMNLFFDSGYISDAENLTAFNNLSDSYLYSYGMGLDFVTYYDRMLRIECSVNKLKQTGLYLHFEKYF